jgi:proteasome lid subunit RPN8/RPN11
MRAEKYALENNTTLLGVYHSHPDHPARPSEHDLNQAVPYFSYIIVSVREGKVADLTSWQLNEASQFEEESISQNENYIHHN